MCVLASYSTVTDPSSLVNVVRDVLVADSDCEFVEPESFSLSRKHASVWHWTARHR